MQTQDITKDLERIISQLSDEGKEPTTALIKSRLGSPVPIPAIIAALKSWKSTKRVPKVEVRTSDNDVNAKLAALEARIAELESQVARLETIQRKHQQ